MRQSFGRLRATDFSLIRCGLLVDSHAHLDDLVFAHDRDAVIERATSAGIDHILTVGIDLRSSQEALNLEGHFPSVEVAVGCHPSASGSFEEQKDALWKLTGDRCVRAVGEIGLDYGRCEVPRDIQRAAFRTQLSWADSRGLPVIVHSRAALDDVLVHLKESRVRGVLHCFSGSAKELDRVNALDLHVSFAGNVTYKSAASLRQAAGQVKGTRLLIETDSPYLSPQSRRGRRNEPAHVVEVAEKVADIRNISVHALAYQTSANAATLFGWS